MKWLVRMWTEFIWCEMGSKIYKFWNENRVQRKSGNFFTSWTTIRFSRMTLLYWYIA